MRTFQQMADEAYQQRITLLIAGKDPQEEWFPATRKELLAMGKRPWKDAPQTTYGDRIYGLKLQLVDDANERAGR